MLFLLSLQSLSSIDISVFDTSKVTDFSHIFYGCTNLKSLNLLNFNTSLGQNMKSLFNQCHNLESLDLTSFDTSSVTFMGWMFLECHSLKVIKFPETFNTSKVESMYAMFYECYSLISLNLSSFDTSKVTDMGYMFTNCYNLKYLDIPNFSSLSLKTINYMFYNMSSLIFLNINSFDINSKTVKVKKPFDLLLPDLKICSNTTNTQTYLSKINKNYNCSDICFIENIKIDLNKSECIYSCKDNNYTHECNNICYNECPDDSYMIIRNISNKDNIFVEYEDGVGICWDRNPRGYYLDEDKFYEECYENCDFCYGPGNEKNNSCKKCKSNLFFINEIIYKNNCFEKCQYYYYLNESNDYICTETNNCTGSYDKYVLEKNKCIDKCENDDTYKFEYNNICYEKCPEGTIKSSKKDYFCFGEENIYQSDIGNNEEILQVIVNNILDKYNISEGEEMVFQGENNFVFHITSAENELALLKGKSNNTNKFSVIDLGECGNLLKKHYNINENVSLIIMKYEKITNISSERSLQYDVYEPYNKTKLNLSVCDDINIDIYIPVVLSEKTQNLYNELKELGYDLFDINSPFYNDLCTPFKSPDGTDVLLSDRINSYYYNDDTACQSNCKFSDYLTESQYLKCECDITNSEINPSKAESFNAKDIYQSFFDVLKYSNYKVLKCGKLIFSIDSVTKNLGSILSIGLFVIFFIFLIFYFLLGINQLKNDFSKNLLKEVNKNNPNITIIKDEIEENHIIKENQQNKNNENLSKSNIKLNKENIGISQKINYKADNNIEDNHNKKPKVIKIKKKVKKRIIRKKKMSKKDFLIYKNNKLNKNDVIIKEGLKDIINSSERQLKDKKNINLNKNNRKVSEFDQSKENIFDSYELNNLEYDSAKKFDKRNFIKIYWSLLKRENSVIFTFITTDDHNITFIKYCRFFFLLCTDMAMNVFFFADETMHKMFLDYGKYNFIQQIPQILYSTIISQLIETLLCYLSLTDKYFYQIKNFKRISKRQLIRVIKYIQMKLVFFFVFCSLMFVFYWYLITCFCAVYQSTQVAFIKDSLFSFALGITIPFGIYLIPSLLRIIALKAIKSNFSYVYKFSNLIPLF